MSGLENQRKTPRQSRARASVDFILEAAARVLEETGEAGFNTNTVAQRAGVGIGTLYRHFPDKRSILRALARREMAAYQQKAAAALAGGTGVSRDRALIRAFLHAFEGRTQARRIAIIDLMAHADHAELAAEHAHLQAAWTDAEGRPLSPVQSFVLSRAIQGAMRAAVFEGADFMLSQEFEDELVRMGRAYLGHSTPSRAS